MKIITILFCAAVWVSTARAQTLDTNQLAQDAWINYWSATQPFTANGANWVYENDFRSHPFYPFLVVGPGHYIHCQDCYFYPVDPVRGTALKLNTATRPIRACLASFEISSQDTIILKLGGFDGAHQLSQGAFNSGYTAINYDGKRGPNGWVYSFNRNKWSFLKGPTSISGGYFVQYDPVHDVFITAGSQTQVYSYHANATVTYSGGPNILHPSASVAVDEKRGLLYALQGVSGTVYTLVNCNMHVFNPETGSWATVTPTSGSIPQGDPAAGGGNEPTLNNIAYDPIHDIILYINDDMQNASARVRTFAFNCGTRAWQELSPATPPADRGRLVYNRALNTFILFGGEAGGNISRGGSTKGFWAYRYQGTDTEAGMAAAPVGFIDTRGGSVKLFWQPPAGAGVTGYNIYRAAANPYPKGFAKLNSSAVTDTFYTDATATSGTAYSYRVCAVMGGKEGHLSRHLYTRPGRVLDVAASVETVGPPSQVKVSWPANPEPDVTGYNVYRASGSGIYSSSFPYTKLTASPVSALEYTDNVDLSNGVARGYVVKAVNAFGCESGPSGAATTFPDSPEWAWVLNQVTAQGLRTAFRWQPPARTRINGVNLYRFQNTKVNTAGIITDSVTYWPVVNVSGVTSSYEAMMGAYYARAVNILGQEGFMSDEISSTVTEWGMGLVPAYQRFDYSIYGGPGSSVQADVVTEDNGETLSASPNPFNPVTRIHLRLDRAGQAALSVHDVKGRQVEELAASVLKAGQHTFTFDASRLGSGVYVVRAQAGGKTLTRKIVLVR